MITYKELKELVLLKESGTDYQTLGKVFNISPNKIKKYYLKGKKIISKNVDEADDAPATDGAPASSPGTAAPSQGTVKKWESGIVRGHSNPVDPSHHYEFGTVHSRANPID